MKRKAPSTSSASESQPSHLLTFVIKGGDFRPGSADFPRPQFPKAKSALTARLFALAKSCRRQKTPVAVEFIHEIPLALFALGYCADHNDDAALLGYATPQHALLAQIKELYVLRARRTKADADYSVATILAYLEQLVVNGDQKELQSLNVTASRWFKRHPASLRDAEEATTTPSRRGFHFTSPANPFPSRVTTINGKRKYADRRHVCDFLTTIAAGMLRKGYSPAQVLEAVATEASETLQGLGVPTNLSSIEARWHDRPLPKKIEDRAEVIVALAVESCGGSKTLVRSLFNYLDVELGRHPTDK